VYIVINEFGGEIISAIMMATNSTREDEGQFSNVAENSIEGAA
jgi:hypothetical protein